MPKAEDVINLSNFPIDRVGSAKREALLSDTREKLRGDGCAVLEGFVKAETLPALVKEADDASPNAHASKNRTNAYFTQDDTTLPDNHPKRRFYDRSNAFIPADNFGSDSSLRAIYEWPAFFDFIREVLDETEDTFFRYADPMADIIVNMADEGNGSPWHFDTNNYTVTFALQNADEGGDFEFARPM